MANNQTIMVSLRFNSDTTQAKKDIQGLIQEISKLSTNNLRQGFNHDLTQDIRNASNEVQKFSVMLRDAVNVDTGKLDLTKLNASLKASNTSLSQMANSFAALGNQGVQSFANIVKQINAAEIPLKQTNKIVDKLWLSLKNTVNWQISSSAVHALVGGFESAFRYAEDLNESLNNIRIVTGYSADKMADFAKDANKAAKALSTTTVDYTDASLIYYQQGLTDEEVKQRTDVTIKMANATQESAIIVSDQLTAIWNNFYDGSQSLEYYADVLTKLGAATASSTDEIAEGLEKFAAIGDTIGLSYEYATAALTTITSNTRQSADVVGTALKTIFARMQDLEQGETLDDGTTLGTYAQALEKVGISVLDTEGNLIEMDKILDAMGEKWETLSEAQQVALAQSVAGIRQYNQLVALMDNWNVDDADSMQANLKYIEESGGELQKQADIYAESWAAAQDRVTASAERIYSALIDEDFFIDLLDIGSDFLDLIANLIDGLGGVKGVLATISSYVLTIGKSQIIKELNRISMPSTKKKQQETIDTKINANQQLGRIAAQGTSEESKVLASTYSNISSLQIKMFNNADRLTESQRNLVQSAIEQYEILGKISAEEAKSLDTIKQQIRLEQQRAMAQNEVRINQMQAVQGTGNPLNKTTGAWTQDEINAVNASLQAGGLNALDQNQTTVLMRNSNALYGQAKTNANQAKLNLIQQLNTQLNQQAVYLRELPTLITRYKAEASKLADVSDILGGSTGSSTEQEVAAKVQAVFNTLDATTQQVFNNIQDDAGRTFNDIINSLTASTEAYKADATDILALNGIFEQAQAQMAVPLLNRNVDDQFVANLNAEAVATARARREARELDTAYQNINATLNDVIPKQKTWQESLVGYAQVLSGIISLYQALNGIIDTIYDTDKTVGEKIESISTSIVSQVGTVVFTLKALKDLFPGIGVAATSAGKAIISALGPAGIAIAGVSAVIALIVKLTKTAEQAQIDKAKTEREETQEQITKNKELVKSYQELYNSYKENNEISKELQETSEQLAKKLAKEGEDVLALASNYEELNNRIDEYNAEQNAKQLHADQKAEGAYESEFVNAMTSGKGRTVGMGGLYEVSFGKFDNNESSQADSFRNSKFYTKYGGNTFDIGGETLITSAGADNLVAMYEAGQQAADEMLQEIIASGEEESDVYKNLVAWLEKAKEEYEALKELNEQIESEAFQTAVDNTDINGEKIKTYQDFEEVYNKLREEALATGELEEDQVDAITLAYFKQNGVLSDWAKKMQLVIDLQEKASKTGNETYNIFAEMLKNGDFSRAIINKVDWDALAESEAGQRYSQISQEAEDLGVTGKETSAGNINFAERGQITWTQANIDKYQDQLASLGIDVDELKGSSSTVLGTWEDQGGAQIPIAYTPLLKTEEGLVPLSQNQLDEYLQYLWDNATDEKDILALDKQGLALEDGTKVNNIVAATGIENAPSIADSMHYMGEYGELALAQSELDAEVTKQIQEAARQLVESGEGEANARNLIEKVQNRDVDYTNITEDDDYKALMQQMNALVEGYPELQRASEVLEKTWLVGTGKYAEALEQVQNKLADIKLDNLKEDANDAIQSADKYFSSYYEWMHDKSDSVDVKIQADLEGFEAAMEEVADSHYAVDIEIHTQAEQEFNNITNAIEGIQIQAAKIGENYTVSYEDMRELNNTFPGILEGMQEVADGSYRLKEFVVKDKLETAEEAIKADKEQTISSLNNQKTELEARAANYKAISEAALILAESETDTETEKAKQIGIIDKALKDLEINNSETTANAMMDAQEQVATGSKDNAEILAENYNESFNSIVQGSYEMATQVKNNLDAITDDSLTISMKDIKLNYTGSIGVSNQAEIEAETRAALENIEGTSAETWLNIANTYADLYESTLRNITDIDGMISTIEAQSHQVITDIGKVGKATGEELKKTAERYHEITREIQRQTQALDELSKAKDRAFGSDRLAILNKEIQGYENLKEQQEKLLSLAIGYLAIDAEAVQQQFGGKAIINANTHEIDNWTELYDSATTEEQIEALEQYEETLDKMREQLETVQEIVYNIQDANYEKLEYELELKLDIDDSKIQELEFLLTQYGDNFYKRAEAAVAMMDKVPVYEDLLGTYEEHQEELNQKYAAGKISQADYIDGLKKIRDGYYEQLEALIALDEEMMTYYEDTLAAATSKLEDYTDHMEHLTSVFEHYTNLMEILGKQKDYDAMGDFLGGKAETLRDRLDIAKQYYQILQDQRVEAEKALALANNDEERELLEKNLDAIIDEVDAAEDEVLSLTEEWAEAMKAVIENEMASIADTLEKALTNGLGFDNLMDSFDKLNTRQEEYLTKTNQIYETNKLMRTASKALDETDNKVAKQKLQNFIDETQSLQEQTQLSEYELEIQQAKYDLLLAEIALEEAQNAKSTVRLSRDNEGNFGYVYTADQDAIDDAQQELDDAKNSLYNLSLEGQQDYTDKYLQAQQEMYEALTELQQQYLDGEIASEEEYQRRTEEILYHYYNPDDGVLTTYSKLYNVAVRTDADATADYWAKDYGAMTQNTADWYEAVNEYLIQIEEQTNTWKEVSEAANEDVQGALDNSSEATERLTDESEALKEMLEDEVLDAIEDEIDAVREQTEAYAEQRQELQNLIATYKAYISALNSQIKSASSTSSGSSDYSYLMTEAYLNGDTDAYNTAAANRVDKLASGNYSSVDQDRLEGVFAAANNGNEKAQELIEKVYDKKLQYTDSTLKQYGFDTGGYTGEWGPEGKLAFLHQKELVLNQDDTENLLTAVSFIRELVNVIDSKASLASLFNLSSAGVANSSSALEQNVHIEASFPNATNHSEIEEAFENLVNKASQYANRK